MNMFWNAEKKYCWSVPRYNMAAQGFTLLELLVVMVIIGLLAGYVAPKYFSQVGKSEVKVAQAQLDSLEKALDQYRLDTGHYPATEQGLTALMTRPANEPRWQGPYLKKAAPPDPWGRPYIYKYPGVWGSSRLISYLSKWASLSAGSRSSAPTKSSIAAMFFASAPIRITRPAGSG